MSMACGEREGQPVRTSMGYGVAVLHAKGCLGLQSHPEELRAQNIVSLLPYHTPTAYAGLQNCE